MEHSAQDVAAFGSRFRRAFGNDPQAQGSAPGRVNLIGEHTDYTGGFVLPVAVPQQTMVEVTGRDDSRVRATSSQFPDDGIVEMEIGAESRRGRWEDFVQGITQQANEAGLALRGFEAAIESQVPLGAGLASSAALSIALLRALRSLFSWNTTDVDLALLAQKSENEFVGAPVGIMDPMAAAFASTRSALFLDTLSLQHENIALPEECEIAVLDSGIKHRHSEGGYRTRREECERALQLLGVRNLREFIDPDLVCALPEPLNRRVRHILTENERVLETVEALRHNNVKAAGAFLYASHQSLRLDYEVSLPELDEIVERAMSVERVYGARLTGGGFGGSVLILTERHAARFVAQTVAHSVRNQNPIRILLPPTTRVAESNPAEPNQP